MLITVILLTVSFVTYRVGLLRGFGQTSVRRVGAAGSSSRPFHGVELSPAYRICLFVRAHGLCGCDRAAADERRLPWFAAGLWLGAGMAFKSVAAFYLICLSPGCWFEKPIP